MRIGVIADLAVGAHPGGADAWAYADVLVPQVSVGAPPDEFNQRGQDWGQPPWHPGRLAAAGYRPLAGLMRAAFGHTGGLRADHVMGLFRLWWVPAGMTPDQGTYVRYRARGDGRRARRRSRRGRRAGDRGGPRHGRGLGPRLPGRPGVSRHVHAVVRARAGTACRCRPGAGATAAWPRSAPTTSRRWRRSSPASRSRSGPASACSPASRRPSRPPPRRPCGPGRMPSPGRGWP